MPAIPPKDTPVVDHPWDGPAVVASMPNDGGEEMLRAMYAWVDPEADPTTKAAYKFPHHDFADGKVGAANMAGCRAGMSRVPQAQIPPADDEGVRRHLQTHMDAAKADMAPRAQRAQQYSIAVRSQPGDFEVREEDGGTAHLVGHFSVFDQWTEIDSKFEGRFLERVAPGAFAKTIADRGGRMPVTFNHGKDPTMGDQVLGRIVSLDEDTIGARYDVELFDGIPPLILDGLRKNAYGSSFRFRVVPKGGDAWTHPTKPTPYNPERLPERTITQAEVFEFGPVTYPAYAGATAGVRSTTDDYLLALLRDASEALPDDGAEVSPHSDEASRDDAPTVTPPEPPAAPPARRFRSDEDWLAFLKRNTDA